MPLALLLRAWLATLRFRCNVERVDDGAGPSVLLLWHDKLFVSSWIANRYFRRPVTALISTSKDGAWLVAFFRLMGIDAVRGSSSRRGAAALVALTRSMRAGNHAGITPDGPKGPALEFKSGAVSLARLTRTPFLVMGIRYHACWRMRSWDRFALPVPFSKVEVTLLPEPAPMEGEEDAAVVARLQAKLTETSTGPA
jgi:lysophospholipid acyltransferase (LPLAT)-like uncharacterized protein